MPLTPGTRLGAYEILAALGAGGMGEVYRARDNRLGREVALKVLPAAVSRDTERLARFEREARTVAALNHPNIVTLFSVEDAGEVRFLTMELVEGKSLDHELAPGGLPVPRVIELGIALADALAAAHEKGVVHRDLKPANVMLTKDGRVKVLDFGLAKLAEAGTDLELTTAATVATPLTGAGMIAGTVPYMAPEQLRGEAVDARTDLFALGVVLYELASGRRPFAGETHADVSSAILRDTPQPLAGLRGDLPAEFARIVARCLEKSPRERVQTALDVSNELRRLRKGLERSEAGIPVSTPVADKVASIAVLPFANRSASADDEYFSDGVADELLNTLAKIRGLRVAARTSAFHFKGKDATIADIGRALNVATVLEGSVRKSGNRVRISVQLVKVEDGYHLWSETYDRTLDDVFAVQDDIAQSVVKELRTTLLGETADSDASGKARAEVGRAAKGRGTDPEAHRLYLQGRHLLDQRTYESVLKAVDYLEQAVARDPGFALAWSELARAHWNAGGQGWAPRAESFARALREAERALALEPDRPEAFAQLAYVKVFADLDWRGAEASVRRALALAPGNPTVVHRAANVIGINGHIEEALALFERAVEQDPLSAKSHHNLALYHGALGHAAEAARCYRAALELTPNRAGTRGELAGALVELGRIDEALAEAEREPHEITRHWALAIALNAAGRKGEARAVLQPLIDKFADEAAFQIAEVFEAMGETDAVFEWLERAIRVEDPGVREIRMRPIYRRVRGDARWAPLARQLRFEE